MVLYGCAVIVLCEWLIAVAYHCMWQETPLGASIEEVATWRSKQPSPLELDPRTLAVSRQLFHALHALHLGFAPVLDKIKLIVHQR